MKQWIWILGWFTFLMGSLGMVWKVLRWSKLNWAVCCGCFNAVNHRLFAGKENMVCHVSPISPPFGALWSDNDPQDCLDWFDEFAFDDILERFGESAEVSHELVRESVCVCASGNAQNWTAMGRSDHSFGLKSGPKRVVWKRGEKSLVLLEVIYG